MMEEGKKNECQYISVLKKMKCLVSYGESCTHMCFRGGGRLQRRGLKHGSLIDTGVTFQTEE